MSRLSLLAACLFASTALCSCASEARSDTADQAVQDSQKSAAADLEGGLRQARMLRLAGNYDQAIHTLSQLMLVASDDAQVVGEYGKTLAQMGRAKDATQFLTRAVELSPRDWTLYSALGVAYDQTGDQTRASAAYQQALALKPEEPSVLNNFALSRLMANDPKAAGELAARAARAGGSDDAKIARNIAMIQGIAGKAETVASADAAPKPAPAVATAQPPRPVPVTPVQNAPLPQTARSLPFVNVPQAPVAARAPTGAPRALIQATPTVAAVQPRGVVMQRVPVDPLAGPVKPKAAKVAQQPAPKTEAVKAEPAAPKTAKADAPKPEAAKPKTEIAKAAPVKAAPKPATKAADAKPVAKPAPAKAAAKDAAPKDGVPALRMTAAAY